MLPTEPQSDLNPTVNQADKPVLKSVPTVAASNPMLKFAKKAGGLIMQHPFWVLVVGSVGIHAAFAVIAPNPLKKPEPQEVVVSTLPVVKLPSKSLPSNIKSNKSLFDNLLVKPPTNKINSSLNTFPTFPNMSSSAPLNALDFNTFDSLDNLPPVSNDFSFSIPPLSSNNTTEAAPQQSIKPQTRVSAPPTKPTPPIFTKSGQINNTNPIKKTANNSNLKPEFQNGGLKNSPTPDTPATSKNTGNTGNGKNPDKVSKNLQGILPTNTSTADPNEKEIGNISSLYTTDKQIIDLVSRNLIRTTQIAPADALISNPDLNREKGVTWIPPKVTNITGKTGSVTFMWLVDPNGEVQTRFLKSSGIKELDDIARETVKDYKFKPIEDPQSGKYRLVTAKYEFP